MYPLLIVLGLMLCVSGIIQALAPIVLVIVKTACWFFLLVAIWSVLQGTMH